MILTNKPKLQLDWFRLMESEDKVKTEEYIRNCSDIVEVFKKKIEELEAKINELEASEVSYEGDWAYLQAHRNGKKEALRLIKKLTQHLE